MVDGDHRLQQDITPLCQGNDISRMPSAFSADVGLDIEVTPAFIASQAPILRYPKTSCGEDLTNQSD